MSSSHDWHQIHDSYIASIKSIDYPEGSGSLTLRRKVKRSDGQWQRNGIKYLKERFFDHLTRIQGWEAEKAVKLNEPNRTFSTNLFPSGESYDEPITSNFGGFDFVTLGNDKTRVAIEWETGNISSSHRSMNKLAISLQQGIIQAGVLIIPSRLLYEHLTDRIGNIGELSGYLQMWAGLKESVNKGLFAISIVEHDNLTDEAEHSYLPTGLDGRAREGLSKRRN